MLALARGGAAEAHWLYADAQIAGRGRQGRNWVSPPGNLYASGLLRLRDDDPPAASLALVAGVALVNVLQSHAPVIPYQLKWPNDVLCNGAKLAGILLEREGEAVVIGIGVNIAHHPSGLDRPAISLVTLGSVLPSLAKVVQDLAEQVAHWVRVWRTDGLSVIVEKWLRYAHPLGTLLSVNISDSELISGSFAGITETGALILRLADGTLSVISAGDVSLRKE